jgi:hypothetical protein
MNPRPVLAKTMRRDNKRRLPQKKYLATDKFKQNVSGKAALTFHSRARRYMTMKRSITGDEWQLQAQFRPDAVGKCSYNVTLSLTNATTGAAATRPTESLSVMI